MAWISLGIILFLRSLYSKFSTILYRGVNKCGGRPLLHEHEVAVQSTNQPGNITVHTRLARTALEQ